MFIPGCTKPGASETVQLRNMLPGCPCQIGGVDVENYLKAERGSSLKKRNRIQKTYHQYIILPEFQRNVICKFPGQQTLY